MTRRRLLTTVYTIGAVSFFVNNASIVVPFTKKLKWVDEVDAQTFVQKNSNANAATGSAISVSVTAVGVGNAIIGTVTMSDEAAGNCSTTGVIPTITDNSAALYTKIDTVDDAANTQCLVTFFKAGINNGPTSIIASFSQSTTLFGIAVQEWSGLAASPLDKHAISIATSGTNVVSGTVTPSTTPQLLYGGFANDNNGNAISSAGGSFTLRNNNATINLADESQVQGTAAAIQASFNLAAAGGGPIAIATFKVAAATSNTPYNPYIASPQLASILAQHHDMEVQSDVFVEHPFRRRRRYFMALEAPLTEDGGKARHRKPFNLDAFLHALRERDVRELASV